MVVKKGWYLGGRKWFIRLDRNRVAALVNNVQIVGYTYGQRNPTRSPLRPPRQQPPDRIQRRRASSFRPRLRRHQSQFPGPAERVLVHADTNVHPDLLNSRFGYVSISRASHQATLFTDDMAKLGPQLGADVSKTSALEINQTSSIAQGIGLGL